jgi:hypothetical protein
MVVRTITLASLAAATLFAAGFWHPEPAKADTIYTLGNLNTSTQPPPYPGPYGFLDVHLVDPTHATLTWTNNVVSPYTYGFDEFGANINATTFTYGAVSNITMLLSGAGNPTFTESAKNLDGYGNFSFVEHGTPQGAPGAMAGASVTITDTSGTWASDAVVLHADNKGENTATHTLVFTGSPLTLQSNAIYTGYDSDNSHCSGPNCPDPSPHGDIPEPATLVILGTGLLGLGVTTFRRRRA